MDPVTTTLVIAGVRKAGKSTWSWLKLNWRLVVAAVLLVMLTKWVYNLGQANSDAKWLKTYNAAVKDYNSRLELLKLESKRLSDQLAKDEAKIIKDVDKAADKVKDESAREEKSGDKGVQCPITVNSKMPQSVLDAWAEMNAAADLQLKK